MGLMEGFFVGGVVRVGEGRRGREREEGVDMAGVCKFLFPSFFTFGKGDADRNTGAALHGKESEPEAHSQPSWSLLMNEAKADVVRREEFDPYIKDKSWTCAHC
jgi:hypothetical protein